MSNVYESIMTGLTDAQNNGNGEILVRHTLELPDNLMMLETETAPIGGE